MANLEAACMTLLLLQRLLFVHSLLQSPMQKAYTLIPTVRPGWFLVTPGMRISCHAPGAVADRHSRFCHHIR